MNLQISRTLFQWIWIHLTGVLLVGFWPLFGFSPRCSDLVSLAKFLSNLYLFKVNNIFIVDGSTGTSNNAFFFPTDAIRWTRQPEKPTILVEGLNNSYVRLVWEFLIEGTSEGAEILEGVTFRRQRDAGDSPVVIAKNRNGGAFTVFPQFRSNYSATVPATLLFLRTAVARDPDFIYSIEVSFLRNNLPQPVFRDAVQVIVRGKNLKLFLRLVFLPISTVFFQNSMWNNDVRFQSLSFEVWLIVPSSFSPFSKERHCLNFPLLKSRSMWKI